MRLLVGALALVAVSTFANAAEPVVAISPEAQRALLASSDPQLAANKRLVLGHVAQLLAGRPTSMTADTYLAPSITNTTRTRKRASKASRRTSARRTARPIRVKDSIDRLISIVAERDLVVFALVREGKDKDGKAVHDHVVRHVPHRERQDRRALGYRRPNLKPISRRRRRRRGGVVDWPRKIAA